MKFWVRYKWQATYLPAVLEKDPSAVSLKIYEALSACRRRRLSPLDADEEKALGEAEAELHTMLNDCVS
jgi:hypothetical protein